MRAHSWLHPRATHHCGTYLPGFQVRSTTHLLVQRVLVAGRILLLRVVRVLSAPGRQRERRLLGQWLVQHSPGACMKSQGGWGWEGNFKDKTHVDQGEGSWLLELAGP